MAEQRIAVIGGGVIGLAIAYHLSRRPESRVVVYEQKTIASGSSRWGSGGLRSQFQDPAETQLAVRARELWTELEDRHDVDLGFRQVGYLLLATTGDQAEQLNARKESQHALGVDIVSLSRTELEQRCPGLNSADITLAAITDADGFARPRHVAGVVAVLARQQGVEIREHTRVQDVSVDGGAVAGVVVDGQVEQFDAVVNAAGNWAPTVTPSLNAVFPVTPKYYHQFLFGGLDWLRRPIPCVQLMGSTLYLRPDRPGTVLVGGVDDGAERAPDDLNLDLLAEVREDLRQRWPRLADADLSRGWVGPYEVTPDQRPCIGRLENPQGVFYANGFSGHGFMLSLSVGEAVAEMILDGRPSHAELASFGIERFAGP